MAGKYDLKKSPAGKFMFNLKAGNGLVILTSELYETKKTARNGIASVQKNSGDGKRYERKQSKKGQPYFVLKTRNSQIVGTSQMYSSQSSMEGGIASMMKNGPKGEVADNT
jgi:hypothetical protein